MFQNELIMTQEKINFCGKHKRSGEYNIVSALGAAMA